MFFCMISGRLGWNNNPSALEFRRAYKQLLVKNEVKSKVTGNCIPLSNIPLLSWSKNMLDNNAMFDPVIFSENRRNYESIASAEITDHETDQGCLAFPENLSELSLIHI